jgi:8-oxo-dGTP pyrophosphatase MutT (NUDIX family)
MPARLLTLCLIQRDGKILLGRKKRGFGVGHWNGFGGKVEAGETIIQAAARELEEEAEVQLKAAEQKGRLLFRFDADPTALDVHVFAVTDFAGEPKETEEMAPQWFDLAAIPYDSMWADDQYWLPLFLEGKYIKADFHFADLATIKAYTINSFSSAPQWV